MTVPLTAQVRRADLMYQMSAQWPHSYSRPQEHATFSTLGFLSEGKALRALILLNCYSFLNAFSDNFIYV